MPWKVIQFLGIFRARFRELAKMAYLWRVPHALIGSRSPSTTPLDTALVASLQALGIGKAGAPTATAAA